MADKPELIVPKLGMNLDTHPEGNYKMYMERYPAENIGRDIPVPDYGR